MLLERLVVTPAGRRYAIYRTCFSEARIGLDGGEVTLQLTPNPAVVARLRSLLVSTISPSPTWDNRVSSGAVAGAEGKSSFPFE